jgi:hypothetical protein
MERVSTIMANLKNIVEDIKKDLAKVRPQDRTITTKGIIDALVEDIHAQMKHGARLDDVYAIIRARLPEETRLTLTTFKRYWRESCTRLGLSKMKNSGKKKKPLEKPMGQDPCECQQFRHIAGTSLPKSLTRETSSDFRADPDEF